MSDVIRIELTGKRSKAWNRVFDTLTGVVEKAVEQLAPHVEEGTRRKINDLTHDLAEVTKGFVKAKMERPTLENERILVDIAAKFEELKLTRANRKRVEMETEIRRLDLWEKRMALAIKWLGFLSQRIVHTEEGGVVLVLTNQDLAALVAEVKEVRA